MEESLNKQDRSKVIQAPHTFKATLGRPLNVGRDV